MKNTRIILTLTIGLWMVLATSLAAQNMPRTVVGNAGDYYDALQFGNLHWTVGEVAVSLHQNGLELGEGFHQAYYELIVTTEDAGLNWEVTIYPNPTADFLHLRFPEQENIHAQLFGSSGELLISRENLSWESELDLNAYPAGTYWLRLQNQEGQQQSFQIMKIKR